MTCLTDWSKVPAGWCFSFYGEKGKGWYGPNGQFNPYAPRPIECDRKQEEK